MKKFLTLVLGIFLLVPGVFIMSACEQGPTMEAWDGTITTVSNPENGVLSIRTAEELAGFARSVNQGKSYEGVTVRLENDMDMKNRTWTPIGIGNRSDLQNASPFTGTFDGNGKKILGLTNKGYVPELDNKNLESDFTDNVYTYQYGFFGITKNATIKNLTVVVDFECDDKYLKGDSVGGLVGFATEGLTIIDCNVYGEVEGYDAVGGLVGRAYNCSSSQSFYVKNSTNNADVEALYKGAGIVGYLNSSTLDAIVDGCVNNGEISVEGMVVNNLFFSAVAGILNYGWDTNSANRLILMNNLNNGELSSIEEEMQDMENRNSYAYIANSVGHELDEELHSYCFTNNSNTGTVEYLDQTATDALLILDSQSYPAYNAENEYNNRTNMEILN